ncbi:MAG TPA: hypothetical protein VM841_04490, partial [Actinomycetota bacterium]|nr:hypothetical protein [Actinomycetota bacterium]
SGIGFGAGTLAIAARDVPTAEGAYGTILIDTVGMVHDKPYRNVIVGALACVVVEPVAATGGHRISTYSFAVDTFGVWPLFVTLDVGPDGSASFSAIRGYTTPDGPCRGPEWTNVPLIGSTVLVRAGHFPSTGIGRG